jgi:hypothetical protein
MKVFGGPTPAPSRQSVRIKELLTLRKLKEKRRLENIIIHIRVEITLK